MGENGSCERFLTITEVSEDETGSPPADQEIWENGFTATEVQDKPTVHRADASVRNTNGYMEPIILNYQPYAWSPIMVQEIDEGQPCLQCGKACQGFRTHGWRKVCARCKCPRELHDIYQRDFVNVQERLGINGENSNANMPGKGTSGGLTTATTNANSIPVPRDATVNAGYSWVPPGLTKKQIEEYMAQLSNNKIPRLNTAGEKYRDKQLMVQLPRQDLAAAYCKHLGSVPERKAFDDFVNIRNEAALDIGYVNPSVEKRMECRKCNGILDKGDMAVMAPKFGSDFGWHPACFVCAKCDELLVDLTYNVRDGKIYCERHYAETVKPRCSACDEVR